MQGPWSSGRRWSTSRSTPSALAGDAYNAALGSATIGMVAAFTRAVVVPDLDPDVVVVGISSRELNANAPEQDAIESRFFDASELRHRLGTESILDRADRVLGDVFEVVRYRSVLRDPENWIDPTPAWDGSITRDDGLFLDFLDSTYHDDPTVLRRMRYGALRDFEIGSDQVATLRRLLTDLRRGGRRVLLLATPVSQDYVDQYPRGAADHERYLATVSDLADEVGVEFASAGVWDDAYMADPLHTNGAGARRLTQLVRDTLS